MIAAAGACRSEPDRVLHVLADHVGPAERRVAAAFEGQSPGARVRWLERGGLDDPGQEGSRAEVWWGGDGFEMAAAQREGLLAPLPPAFAGPSPDPSGRRWRAVELVVPVVAFNVDSVSRGMAPPDWPALFHVLWGGRVLAPDPQASAAGRVLLGWIMERERARSGGDAAGMDWLLRLDGAAVAYGGDHLVRDLAAGRGRVAIADVADVERARAGGAPVDWLVPASGTPLGARGIALFAGADTALARAFLAAALGEPGRTALGEAHRLHALGGAGDAPWAARTRERIVAAPLDADTVSLYLDGWIARWRTDVKGRGGTR